MQSAQNSLQEAQRLHQYFQALGAQDAQVQVLQPAEILLDLYGEDIRSRAYVTPDPLRGDMVLRPDFTVPVVQQHMANDLMPARYTYSGKVFRMQESDALRPNEYIQVGYELFEQGDPAVADAEVFLAIAKALSDLPLRIATGDINLLSAAVRGLNTTAARKAALMRHLWRPQRFRALLKRFASASADRKAQKQKLFTSDPFAQCGPQIGLRGKGEIEHRIQALRHEAETPALSETEVDLLEALLKIKESCPYALAQLRDLVVDMPAISTAVEGFSRRLNALDAKGVDVSSLAFETSYGRSSMEYYDGFVFGFYAQNGQNGLSAIASGGRYDALTKQLGKGVTMPAVGGVIRPDLVVALRGAV